MLSAKLLPPLTAVVFEIDAVQRMDGRCECLVGWGRRIRGHDPCACVCVCSALRFLRAIVQNYKRRGVEVAFVRLADTLKMTMVRSGLVTYLGR